ncbi:MAG: alpha/beta fold hydrolase [Rhodospirillaceae bacterium]|nr:alpha/beta fold hydrolase [Rhodospirillaceae bacterium]MYJ71916.1 alpha/beta fold hydrolase [Rhodospirillaceae bacterium]
MTFRAKRQTVDLAGREVGFRYAGSGPPAVLLHESPRSSVALLPLMERLAGRFTVFGFDTPGFGGSDPLAMDRPSSADYADALADAMTALGIARAPVYGTHTGACIAMDLALGHPDRVSVAVMDGYPVFTPAEQEELLRAYLPPFRPSWDGAHVAWLWARVRDQFTFFPWYAAGNLGRLPRDPPPLDFHQLVVEDFLRAGDHYRPAYAAAFRFDGMGPLARVQVPVAIVAREDDLLFPHLDRLPDTLPDRIAVHRLGADRDAWGVAVGDIMAAHPGQATAPQPAADLLGARPVRRRFIETPAGAAHVRFAGPQDGRPVVLLHRTPGQAAELDDWLMRLGRHGPAIAIDLPGNGESDLAEPTDLSGIIAWIGGCLDALGVRECDLAGEGTGAAFAAALAADGPVAVRRLTLAQAPAGPDRGPETSGAPPCPDLSPRWDGAHLAAAWYWARDSLLYRRWDARTAAGAWRLPDDPPVGLLHARFTGAVLGAQGNEVLCRAAHDTELDRLIDRAAHRGAAVERFDMPLALCPVRGD